MKYVTVFVTIILSSSGLNSEEIQKRKIRPGNHGFSIRVGNIDRSYIVHVPKNYDGKTSVPLLIMFHGAGGTGRVAMKETGLAEKSDKEGFLAVFPEGSRPDQTRRARFRDNQQTWNDGSNRKNVGATQSGVDDVAFVNALIDDITLRFSVDRKRIYASGFSNGSSMAYRVARELSDRIAAIATSSGADWLDKVTPSRPVSVLFITGTADTLTPVEGGDQTFMGKVVGRKPPVIEQMQKWAKILGCTTGPKVFIDSNGVKAMSWGGGKEGSEVVLYLIDGMGHTWAGGMSTLPERAVGKTSDKIIANDVIWDFFKKHPVK